MKVAQSCIQKCEKFFASAQNWVYMIMLFIYPSVLQLSTPSTSSCIAWARQGAGNTSALHAPSLCVMLHARQKQQFRRKLIS